MPSVLLLGLQALLAASLQLGPGDMYYRLWPLAPHFANPWTLVVDRVLDLVRGVHEARGEQLHKEQGTG